VLNVSGIILPIEIVTILERGPSHPLGGKPFTIPLMATFENLLAKWNKYADEMGVDPVKKFLLKGSFIDTYGQLLQCHTDSKDQYKLKKFLEENRNIVIIEGDKEQSLVILTRDDYENSVRKEFPTGKFTMLQKSPLQDHQKKFNEMLKLLTPYIDDSLAWKVRPLMRLKSCHGLAKTHKESFSEELNMRPIVSSRDSLCTRITKNFLLKIISKLETPNTVNSTSDFKKWFLNEKTNFSDMDFDFGSIDATKLFPSVNTVLLIKMIVDVVYKKPTAYLGRYFDKNGKLLKRLPKKNFQTILEDVLTKFTAFEFGGDIYQQNSGLSMGCSLSPKLANFYLSQLEGPLVEDLKKKGILLSYVRFMDDTFMVTKKGYFTYVKEEFNNLEASLAFTSDLPVDGKLKFLDTQISRSEELNTLEFQPFVKNVNGMRFNSSVAPKSMKRGLVTSELWRLKNSSSSEKIFRESLPKFEEKYKNLEYPPKLIKEKIDNFGKENPNKRDWNLEKSENPNRNFTITIPFTSQRVEKVCRKLKEKIRTLTPLFNLHVASKTISIRSILLRHLRIISPKENEICTVYQFVCPCKSAGYIGESERPLRTRILEHGQRSRDSPIYTHTTTCTEYMNSLHEKFGRSPSAKESNQFLMDSFRILHRGLSSYGERTLSEALQITLKKPNLNAQIKHKKVHFT
jgi:hypothetical protein